VNKEYYLKVTKNRQAVRRKRPDFWKWRRGWEWLLHNNNAPVHSPLLIHDSVIKHEMTLIPQPLHSPDLAPADFYLITKLKSILKGKFESVKDIKENLFAELHSILKDAF
jgi:transposase